MMPQNNAQTIRVIMKLRKSKMTTVVVIRLTTSNRYL